MSTTQLFFSILAVLIAQTGALATAFKYYVDAKFDSLDAKLDLKIDPVKAQVDLLVQYMVDHEGRIATLEERTKHLSKGSKQ